MSILVLDVAVECRLWVGLECADSARRGAAMTVYQRPVGDIGAGWIGLGAIRCSLRSTL